MLAEGMNLHNNTPLIRISLIVTILSCLTIGGLNIVKVREKVRNLQASLREQTAGRQKAEAEVSDLKREMDRALAALKEAKATVETSKEDRNQALAIAAAQTKLAEQLRRDLADTRKRLAATGAELERYTLAGMVPEQIISAATQLKELQHSLAAARNKNDILRKANEDLTEVLHPTSGQPVRLPAGLQGTVLVSDPKWHFVVLSAGETEGVLERGELLVNRAGKLVAKVVVTSVQKDRCIANVVPGWGFAEIVEGDHIIPAHPQPRS